MYGCAPRSMYGCTDDVKTMSFTVSLAEVRALFPYQGMVALVAGVVKSSCLVMGNAGTVGAGRCRVSFPTMLVQAGAVGGTVSCMFGSASLGLCVE